MSVPDKMQTQDDIIEGIVRNEQSALGNNERSIQKRKSEICNELTIFRNNVVQYRQSILLASQSPHWSALTWWQEYSDEFPILSTLTITLFSLGVSTSSVERSFKTQGNIHSKVRNRLHDVKCSMLMTIKMNSHLLTVIKLTSIKRKLISDESESIAVHDNEVIKESEDDSDFESDDEDLKEVIELDDDSDENYDI